ncbi:MAG: MarC family protein, partial [Nitrospirota bacterium]|nr:MarC family protein [Nitrospirota bacterium]
MVETLKHLPHTFIPLFVAIDIFAVLPIFISMTYSLTEPKREKIIRESILTALIASIIFTVMGETIFRMIGITTDDFKIAGGLVLLVFAVLDLTRRDEGRKKLAGKFGVVPIGVPLIVGPAVLTTLLVLVDHYGFVATVISLLLNLLIVWSVFKKGQSIIKILGEGGIIAISKVMALLLAAIAIMMIRIGLEN